MVNLKDKKWNDWTDFYANGGAHNQEDPLSRPLKKGMKGADIADQFKDMLPELREGIDQMRQPTDEELFGHLVVTEEELEKREKNWENLLVEWERMVKSTQVDKNQNEEWGNGRSFNSYLSDEELEERKKYVGDH